MPVFLAAWAATFEVGVPAAILGAVLGLVVGAVVLASSRGASPEKKLDTSRVPD